MTDHGNVYEDSRRAEAYASLEFPGTYYLAFRDIPDIVADHVKGKTALDFGCGAGRSTRFAKKLGFDTVGIDISAAMLARAREFDPDGDYRLVPDGDLSLLAEGSFDLVFSAFTFDNIPTRSNKLALFRQLGEKLTATGRLLSMVSSPEIYVNEWASFTTRDFPENKSARSGDPVKIIMTDVGDRRPVIDTVFSHEDYLEVYATAGLEVVNVYRPLAREEEPFAWVSETRIAPWVIYVLKRA
jgi:SAM-dependent methyltransferase